MAMKPIDLQINILQMNNAAKEISKQKKIGLNQQHYAAALTEKDSVEKSQKVEQADKVEPTLAPLENEEKDERGGKHQGFSGGESKKKDNDDEISTKSFFDDPSKGIFIDIKE